MLAGVRGAGTPRAGLAGTQTGAVSGESSAELLQTSKNLLYELHHSNLLKKKTKEGLASSAVVSVLLVSRIHVAEREGFRGVDRGTPDMLGSLNILPLWGTKTFLHLLTAQLGETAASTEPGPGRGVVSAAWRPQWHRSEEIQHK